MTRLAPWKDSRWMWPARRGWSATTRLGATMLNLVYPPQCVHCGSEMEAGDGCPPLCPDCCRLLGPEQWLGCRRCGAVVEGSPRPQQCPTCRRFGLQFDATSPLGTYDGALRQVVLAMKRLSRSPLSAAVGQLLAERRGAELAQFRPSVIVPIPMHWWRRMCRGVNSAEVVAESVGRRLNVPVARRALVRRRHTAPQRDLSPRQRFLNVRGAFGLRRADPARWKDSHVLLVDDILTTGATCSEAARVLKEAGAAAVAVAVVARALT